MYVFPSLLLPLVNAVNRLPQLSPMIRTFVECKHLYTNFEQGVVVSASASLSKSPESGVLQALSFLALSAADITGRSLHTPTVLLTSCEIMS